MICRHLRKLWTCTNPRFSPHALALGSEVSEPKVRPGCQFSPAGLAILHEQKEWFITHGCVDGLGCQQERRDLATMLVWASDFQAIQLDRKHGRVN